jgi:hypothetical protein
MWTAAVMGAFVAPSLLASPAVDHHQPEQQFWLIESGGGLGVRVENTTVFLEVNRGAATTWSVQRDSTENNWCGRKENGHCIPTRTSSHEWINGRSCAPLSRVLMQLTTARTKERGSTHPLVTDTPLLSLILRERGHLAAERLSEYTGPLVDWWQSAQEQLKACWTKTPPADL